MKKLWQNPWVNPITGVFVWVALIYLFHGAVREGFWFLTGFLVILWVAVDQREHKEED